MVGLSHHRVKRNGLLTRIHVLVNEVWVRNRYGSDAQCVASVSFTRSPPLVGVVLSAGLMQSVLSTGMKMGERIARGVTG
jgi:hypothetical protein